ncbi:hypothetical protein HCJ88_14095 [Lacticaseibacillus paracasei]|uniref:Uncharacterized protein n=1 Tax=Lacticaseibacillus paracasei TaxID=1597 RepID=A0ABD7BWX3_LACPA|nr:hypothetical protein HCJ88_14095 [Lacticaseibacillus paracasei]
MLELKDEGILSDCGAKGGESNIFVRVFDKNVFLINLKFGFCLFSYRYPVRLPDGG